MVADFDPLREKQRWRQGALAADATFYEVDAHNVIPCWCASNKQEFGARTLRLKLHQQLPLYFEDYPEIKPHPIPWREEPQGLSVDAILAWLKANGSVAEVGWLDPGEDRAWATLDSFISQRLSGYNLCRNDPNTESQSGLSPYLHFGHISAQRVALRIVSCKCDKPSADAFLEELLVRRELSDNFCFYNHHYDCFEGFPLWARRTLDEHRRDRRAYLYGFEEFEASKTHDDLWNAAQMEMVKGGRCMATCACTGRRRYWSGPNPQKRPSTSPYA